MSLALEPEVDVATCRICGCTEEEGCLPTCHWVPDPAMAGDLCSACLETLDENGDPRPVGLDDVDERHARLMKASQALRLCSAAVAIRLEDAGCDVVEVTDVLEDVLLALELATGQLDLRYEELVPQLDVAVVDEDDDPELCMSESPDTGPTRRQLCTGLPGHTGRHHNDDTLSWS